MAAREARAGAVVKAMVGGLEATRAAVESPEVAARVMVESATMKGVAVRVVAKAAAGLAEVVQGGLQVEEVTAAAARGEMGVVDLEEEARAAAAVGHCQARRVAAGAVDWVMAGVDWVTAGMDWVTAGVVMEGVTAEAWAVD